jgi:hypothetical protein
LAVATGVLAGAAGGPAEAAEVGVEERPPEDDSKRNM